MILVNALGCTVTGARKVARELVSEYTGSERVVAVVADHGEDFHAGAGVRVIPLSHRWFGRWLRPAYELTINLLLFLGVFSRCVNLSHYGLCWSGTHHLYIHSPELVANNPSRGFSGGKMNFLKGYFFGTCLRRADRLYVQTSHMRDKLVAIMNARGLDPGRVELLRPLVSPPQDVSPAPREFPFQAFYPVSPFRHKRADLATEAVSLLARRGDTALGLVITIDGPDAGPAVRCIGHVDHDSVLRILRSSDFLLFTSEQETLGLPLLEALQAGLPAVLPEVDYATELYGDAAVYYSTATPDSVADAVVRLKAHYQRYRDRVPGRLARIMGESRTWAEHWERFLS